MVQKPKTDRPGADDTSALKAHVLILEARFYEAIADMMADGAIEELNARGVTYERIAVPGALELPQALSAAAEARSQGRMAFDGAIALGCVIRGETYHFEIVANESCRGVMDVMLETGLPVANGILTVDSDAQAEARVAEKGADCAHAAIEMAHCLRALASRQKEPR